MPPSFGWIQLVAAAGVAQGIILAAVLAAHRGKWTANRLLAALMAAFSIYLASTVYYGTSLVSEYPALFGTSYPTTWLFGPLVYLYAVHASDAERPMRRRDALHFVPALIVVLVSIPIYRMSPADKLRVLEQLRAGVMPRSIAFIDPTKYLSGIAYSIATVAVLRRHRRRVESNYSTTDRVNLNWLLWLCGCAAAIWLMAFAIRMADLFPHAGRIDGDDVVSVAIALVVYSTGYLGLRQPAIHDFGAWSAAPAEVTPSAAEERAESVRYERSGLREHEASQLKSDLLALMEREHPYRASGLTLADLAARLETSPHKLSQVLNGEVGQTFHDFVNRFRVDDVRRRLADPASSHLNVLTVALDAGFSSKSTFNQAFKKATGETPSSYRRALPA